MMKAAPSSLIVAVLTGDVVGSSKLGVDQTNKLFRYLNTAAERLATWPGNAGSRGFTRSRGDTWQLVLTVPGLALRACLFLRAAIKAADRRFDTRIGIGIGRAERFDPDDVGASDGEAFRLSGARLDEQSRHECFHFGAAVPNVDESLLSAFFLLADRLSAGWTLAQAAVMYRMLDPANADLSQSEIGRLLKPPVPQQQVSRAYFRASGPALVKAAEAFEVHLRR